MKKLTFGINVITGNRDWTIREGAPDGPIYTIEEARREWEAGNVDHASRAFKKLVKSNWDMDALKAEFRSDTEEVLRMVEPINNILSDLIDGAKKALRNEAERN